MNRFSFGLFALAATALAGCGASAGRAPGASGSGASGLAASFVAGRAFDDSQSALKRGDNRALQAAGQRFARARAEINDNGALLRGVTPLSLAGTQLELQAKYAPLSQRAALLARALEKYRAASAFLPANPRPGSVDAQTLNMVGYPLADRGTTRADRLRGAQLTRLSLAQWDDEIKSLPPGSAARLQAQAARTLGALDSYAWALFKLGRIGEALQKQEAVVEFAQKHPEIVASGQYNAEIPFHMAEIYRAAGREDDAQEQYKTALDLGPDPELLLRIDSALNATRI